MEQTIDEFLDNISEAKKSEKFETTPGFELNQDDIAKIVKNVSKIVDFRNKLSDFSELTKVLDNLKTLSSKKKKEITIPTALQKQAQEIKSILNKKQSNFTPSEENKIQKFIEKITDMYKKIEFETSDKDFKELGINTYKAKFEQSFPVKLTVDGKDYYGLVRPPTGVITWQGAKARSVARSVGVPIKMPIMNVKDKKNPVFKVKRGADAYGEFMSKFQKNDKIDFDFDDSDAAKKKVMQALEDAGVSFKTDNYIKRGALKGVEDAIANMKLSDMIDESLAPQEKELVISEGIIKNVKFWKNITEIF